MILSNRRLAAAGIFKAILARGLLYFSATNIIDLSAANILVAHYVHKSLLLRFRKLLIV